MSGRPTVFVDRDGTLIEEVGCVNHPARVRLLPGSAAAVARLNEAGFAVVVVTNQAWIARGFVSEEVVAAGNQELVRQLTAAGARIDGLYFCPHHPTDGEPPLRTDCECRKPKPGMAHRAAADLDLDLAAATVVGDLPSDVALARNLGATSVLVLTGFGRGEWEYRRHTFPAEPDHVADDLAAAVDWILGGASSGGPP